MTSPSALAEAAVHVFVHGFGGILEIEPRGAPPFYVDGREAKCVIVDAPPAGEITAKWRAAPDTLMQIFIRRRALDNSFLSGRLEIAGDMSLMSRLQLEGPP